jgi:hypothetical protein
MRVIAARGFVLLLLLVPFRLLVTPRPGIVLCVAWALVSIWAVASAFQIAVLASPLHRTPGLTVVITLLAGANLLLALYVAIGLTA